MPRENSLSDSERRSLTPDLEEEQEREAAFEVAAARPSMSSTVSPTYTSIPQNGHFAQGSTSPIATAPTQSPPPRTSGVTSPANGFKRSSEQWNRPSIGITPKDRFRTAVRKVISMHRGMTFMSIGMGRGRDTERIGAEPGVDPRRASADMQYGHIHRKCAIEITDYSSLRTTVKMMSNEEFVEMLQDGVRSHRPSWVRVRWINIGGLSWDVIKAMSFRYDLHPLALEDIFHGHGQTRSKADYYPRHLFLRVLCHQLSEHDMDDENVFIPTLRSSSPEPYDKDEDMTLHESLDSQPRRKRRRHILPFHHHDVAHGANHLFHLIQKENRKHVAYTRRDAQMITLNALKRGERVDVEVSPMFIFLFRDGTVISIHSKPNLNFTAPITHRLRQTDTVLRQSPDPSILVHALLDIIVDRALQVVDAYHDKINKFEQDILIKPKAKTIRRLHILSGDLILHKRTLEPVKTLVYGLRRYDVDRCAALIDTSDPASAHVPVVGFMSHKSKIYLADVFDHMEYILASLDMFASIAENLINYSFNSASYEMNVVMRRLTLVTIIGLPLTLLTGYFGMNFSVMWSVQTNSDLFFWKLAIPIVIVIAILALWQDLTQMYHYTSKKVFAKRVVQMKIKNH